jgi:uncharacterized BrkB/YihY/UPF0761 family membrane protein
MKRTPIARVAVIWLISCCLYLVLGFLFVVVVHTGPHDWYHLPGITIEHYYGHGVRLDGVEPAVLLPALAVSYVITWCLFAIASRYGKRQAHQAEQRIEPMRRSAFRLVSHSGVVSALPLMAHPQRWASRVT